MRIGLLSILFFSPFLSALNAQDFRWQQRADYQIEVSLDVNTHRMSGKQKLTYYNNSPDTLNRIYYHLYYNAFQPGSMMDVRSRNIADPDPRVTDRISKLKENEIGYQRIQSLTQDSRTVGYSVEGTILEVILAKPLLPKSKTVLEMAFESQIPLQIRRTGRDNKEGIAYSMTQWYPKIVEYDYQGWHAYPYVAREFHSPFGEYDVKITLPAAFMVAGTGVLVNADKVGHGYEQPGTNVKEGTGNITWHFAAKNVIDFAWTADKEYVHDRKTVPGGPELHFFYQPNERVTANWKKMQDFAMAHFQFMSKTFGQYPYETYSIIQGGDGGMEYPMCTLILGEGSFEGLVGVMVHEVAHSWFQGVLASNEALYPWMDEGFTDFAAQEFEATFSKDEHPHEGSYAAYFALMKSGLQEPLSQHSDHFNTNRAYSVAAYAMGTVFLEQLKYIIGKDNFYRGMRRYYSTWKFRHPEPNDFIRIMEKVSSMQLKWYMNYFIHTTKKIDYSIKHIIGKDQSTFVTLERVGEFPMPVDLVVTFKDGTKKLFYVPLNEMLGSKPVEDMQMERVELEAWPWVNPTYILQINVDPADIKTLEIDPSRRMADVDRRNNVVDLSNGLKAYQSYINSGRR